MVDPWASAAFLLSSLAFSVIWGRLLWYGDERSVLVRHCVFALMGWFRLPHQQTKSMLLSGLYYACGLLGAITFCAAYRFDPRAILHPSAGHWPLVALGIIAEVSLANLLVDLYRRLAGDTDPGRFAELAQLPWMQGLHRLPRSLVAVGACTGGAVEEIMFRGVLLQIMLHELLFPPAAAIALAGAIFIFQQLLQVKTTFQAAVIGSGSAAISVVGGLLVVHTGSVVPAMLCHASFVVFFLGHGTRRSSTA